MYTTPELTNRLLAEGIEFSPQMRSGLVKRGLIAPPVRKGKASAKGGTQGHWDRGTFDRLVQIDRLKKLGHSYEAIAKLLPPLDRAQAVQTSITIWLTPENSERLTRVAASTRLTKSALLHLGMSLYANAPIEVKVALEQAMALVAALQEENPAVRGEMRMVGYWADLAATYYETVDALKQKKALPQCYSDNGRPDVVTRYLIRVAIQDGKLTVEDVQDLPEEVNERLDNDE